MEVFGVILGAMALVVAIGIEWAKRPRLTIEAASFASSGPTAWTFAPVWVRNKPMTPLLRWFLSREPAQGCRATLDFYTWGTDARAIPSVPGRWSGNPEPLRRVRIEPSNKTVTASTGGGSHTVMQYLAEYDPTIDSREFDVRASEAGEQVAVAVLRADGSGDAYAWGTESYAYPLWEKPEWRLVHGTYRVVVTIEANSMRKQREFKLEFLDNDFAKFRLTEA